MTEPSIRYEQILKNIRDGVYTLDASGEITWVNETAVEKFDIGYSRSDLIGSSVSKVLSAEDQEKCLCLIQELLGNPDRHSGRCEISLQTASGDSIPCDLHLALITTEDGEFRGTVGVIRKIARRKRREQRLEVLNRILRHNLSNAMTVILGQAEELREGVTRDDEAMIDAICKRGEELITIGEKAREIQNIHDQSPSQLSSIDVIGPAERVLAEFREEYAAVDVELEFPAEAHIASGNEELVKTALSNLLENAIEHNDADQPRVSVEVQTAGEVVQVQIRDNGPGIPPLERDVLDNEIESPLQHSKGLGLWIARWSVTTCEGDLSFREATPRGTVVTIEFPRASKA